VPSSQAAANQIYKEIRFLGGEMDVDPSEGRFASYIAGLGCVIGHAKRTAPASLAAEHQPPLHFSPTRPHGGRVAEATKVWRWRLPGTAAASRRCRKLWRSKNLVRQQTHRLAVHASSARMSPANPIEFSFQKLTMLYSARQR
jgi:hypothetical protein